MSLKRKALNAENSDTGKRLDQFLADRLQVSKAQVRKWIVAGAVYLNRKRCRIASKPLRENAEIVVWVDEGTKGQDAQALATPELRVLFEDADLIAIDKPAGLPSQPTLDQARANAYSLTQKLLGDRDPEAKGGLPYLGMHHRLDRDTSGILLFTKNPEVNRALGETFKEHRLEKTYLAICDIRNAKMNQKKWRTENYLGRDPQSQNKRARFIEVRSGGKLAVTDFEVLRANSDFALVQAKPLTGRTHQIRTHLMQAGMPIVFDDLYGFRASRQFEHRGRILLHAAHLTLNHPRTDNRLEIQSLPPRDFGHFLKIWALEV